MDFNTVITNAGNGISLQTLFEKGTITFTKIEIGNQICESPENAIALASPKLAGQFLGIEKNEENQSATIKFVFDNKNVVDAFDFLEYGIWAKYINEQGNEVECLYAYGYSNTGNGVEIPAFTNSTSYIKEKLNVTVKVGTPEKVSIYLGEYEDYVDKASFEAHLNDETNPHGVTAKDIGLDEVENVSVSDAIVKLDEKTLADENADDIIQGEKVAIWWAKVKNTLKKFKKHEANIENPHKVTLKQITGAETLADLLKKLITDSAQHIYMAAGRYIYGKDASGNSRVICGAYTSGQPFLGDDEAQYTHVHGQNICIRLSSGLYWYFSNGGHLYPSKSDSCVGTTSKKINRVYAVNAYSSSDRKEKENITDCEIGLAILECLSFKEFNFIDSSEKNVGLIAQDVFDLFQTLGIHNSSVYSVGLRGNDPKKHPELENLTDEQILSYPDEKLTWTLDYQQISNYCIAGFKEYMKKTDKRLSKIENELEGALNNE